jgi:hypothetical protein
MRIDESDEHSQNADLSITRSFEPGSNVTTARHDECWKQDRLIAGTQAGMQMDERTEELYAKDPICKS